MVICDQCKHPGPDAMEAMTKGWRLKPGGVSLCPVCKRADVELLDWTKAREEFPWAAKYLPEIPKLKGFEDQSWHNDVAPCVEFQTTRGEHGPATWRLWIMPPGTEGLEGDRLTYVLASDQTDDPELETEDLAHALLEIAELLSADNDIDGEVALRSFVAERLA